MNFFRLNLLEGVNLTKLTSRLAKNWQTMNVTKFQRWWLLPAWFEKSVPSIDLFGHFAKY